jgi:RNA polymerase sigma-70 factor, ECF subfamily
VEQRFARAYLSPGVLPESTIDKRINQVIEANIWMRCCSRLSLPDASLDETILKRQDPSVDLSRPNNDVQQTSEARTLGDVLFAKTPRPMSEEVWVGLVRSIAGGDQLALHSIYELTHRIVFTLIMRIINNRETTEELTVDVFHDVWRRAQMYDPTNGSVVGWIMNQARSRAIDRLRYEQRKKRVKNETEPVRNGNSYDDPQTALQNGEQSDLLRNALDSLNPEERQAIEIAFFSELTYQEVAAQLNQPLGTIKSRIRSGLGKLRSALAGKSENI